LLDDSFILRIVPDRRKEFLLNRIKQSGSRPGSERQAPLTREPDYSQELDSFPSKIAALKLATTAVMLSWIFYATTAQMLWMFFPRLPLPKSPVATLDPFRIANQYGLFAVMTRGRWEIEFQGSQDGKNWVPYAFRYKQ